MKKSTEWFAALTVAMFLCGAIYAALSAHKWYEEEREVRSLAWMLVDDGRALTLSQGDELRVHIRRALHAEKAAKRADTDQLLYRRAQFLTAHANTWFWLTAAQNQGEALSERLTASASLSREERGVLKAELTQFRKTQMETGRALDEYIAEANRYIEELRAANCRAYPCKPWGLEGRDLATSIKEHGLRLDRMSRAIESLAARADTF